MGRDEGSAETQARRAWWRLPLAVITAPLALSFGLTVMVLLLASLGETTGPAVLDRTIRAGITFTTALLAFSLTFGTVGVALLLILGQRGVVGWAWVGALLGVVAAMLHGLTEVGVVVGSEMTAGGFLGAILMLLIRCLGGIRDPQRPS